VPSATSLRSFSLHMKPADAAAVLIIDLLPIRAVTHTEWCSLTMFVRKNCRRGLEHETLRMDQIAARILRGQAVDPSPRLCHTSNRCDTGKVTVWKSFKNIKCRIYLESRGKRAFFCLYHDCILSESPLSPC
jgi:hypothetical protein